MRKQRNNATPGRDLEFRMLSLRASTANEDTRTVEADLSSESPIPMYDWERGDYIGEVLLSEGAQLPKARQVPLLDSHSRWSTSSLVGSVRDIKAAGDRLRGVLSFSAAAEDEWTKAREGHLTDVSVGYQVLKREHVPEGKTKKIRGREFTGPVNVVTKWRLLEVSVTPIGADEQAKLRGLDVDALFPPEGTEDFAMNEELRKLLESLGLKADASDDEAQRFLVDNADRIRAAFAPPAPPSPPGKKVGNDGDDVLGQLRTLVAGFQDLTPEKLTERIGKAVDAAVQQREQQRIAFRTEVDQLVQIAGFEPEFARGLYDAADLPAARKAIIDERAKRAEQLPHVPILFGAAQRDKHRGAVGTALLHRCFERCQVLNPNSPHVEAREKILAKIWPEAQRAKDWEQFRRATVLELAAECLRMDGFDVRGLTREEIAMCALGGAHQIGIRASDPAYHVTGSFPFITQDAVNKTMMLGYVEFPSTWQIVMTQGDSVPDFKTIHRMQLGAFGNIPIWDGISVPDEDSHKDEEETYAVECRSRKVSYGYKLLVNDDMSMISRTPMKLGDAMARTRNAVAWAQITGNPTMRDGQALFSAATGNRKRQNLTTGAGAPSSTTIGALTNLMMQMRGSNTPEEAEGEDILSLTPAHIVGPSALRTTILKEVLSISDPASNNAGVVNINNNLIPVIEPLLDANSATAWYLFASTARVETVEVTHLQGQETPRLRTVLNADRLSQDHYILQTFAAKALEHRGMQKHAGA